MTMVDYDGDGQRVEATMGEATTAYLGFFHSYPKHVPLDNYRS
jgi:hypothetical protein